MTKVDVELSDETLRNLDALAKNKGISRTEALEQAVATTKELLDRAPNGAQIIPVSARQAKRFAR